MAVLFTALVAVGCIDTAAPEFEFPEQVAVITIQPAEATTRVGKQIPLSALALDSAGKALEESDIIWTSADTSVATVSQQGEVTALSVGSTLITATNGERTGIATLTVLAPQVASVVLSPASAALLAGDTARFAAIPHDDEDQLIDGRSVKWSVADAAIAKVAGGVLVGLTAGSTYLVATVDGVRDSSAVQVSARPLASVSVTPVTITLTTGKTTRLSTTALDDRGDAVANQVVSWSSADSKIATVAADGTVSGKSAGTTTISASVTAKGNNAKAKGAKATVKVVDAVIPVASVALSPSSATVVIGDTKQLSATARDSQNAALGGRTITWSSNAKSVATVSASGLVTAVAAGKATITATSEGKLATSAITVTPPPVASVSVDPGSATIVVGDDVTLTAATLDDDGKKLLGRTLAWSSGRSSVASVSSAGVVKGIAEGSAWIFASSEGKRDSAAIVVKLPAVSSVTVSPTSATLDTGRTKTLSVTLKDASGATLTGRTVTWVSSDKSVATISSGGVVTAIGAGSAEMTAASEGKSAKASITVNAPAAAKPNPTPAQPPKSEPDPTPTPGGGSSSGSHSGIFVSPSGSSSASGTESSPMSLSAALSGGNGKIQAGDTVWLRQGTYKGSFKSSLSGSASAPTVVRQYPGERATIDGNIAVDGSYTWYWGFEVANTNTGTQDVMGIDSHCTGCRFINLVIHDHSGNGLGMWSEGPDQEAYGNVIYNNGFHGSTSSSFGHGIYAQNVSGTKRIIDNILVNQFGYGVHVYTEGSGLRNFTISGNAVVNSGQGDGMDYHVGGMQPVVNLVFTHNMSYRSANRRGNTVRLGYNWGPMNSGAVVTDNYLVGQVFLPFWSSINFERNTIVDPDYSAVALQLQDGQSMPTGTWDHNVYDVTGDAPLALIDKNGGHGFALKSWQSQTGFDLSSTLSTSLPTSTRVTVEPNEYETGRANVIVYNWGHQGAVNVDLSKVLRSGDLYEVRNAANFFGSPVTSGTYGGGSISIPITSVTPAGSITGKSLSATGTEFSAYVVVKK